MNRSTDEKLGLYSNPDFDSGVLPQCCRYVAAARNGSTHRPVPPDNLVDGGTNELTCGATLVRVC